MSWLAFARAVRWGVVHFWRNVWLSMASTGVLLLTLAMLGVLFIVTVVGNASLKAISEKVDITVFMSDAASEEAILVVQADMQGRPDVTSVKYVTKAQAAADFVEANKNRPIMLQALQELGENPLQASLIIKAKSPDLYPQIEASLKSPKYQNLLGKVTSEDNRAVIQRLATIIRTVRRTGLILTIALALIAVLVTFNTIRLAIYSYHEEIEIMHLVGASPWFVRGPFLVEGALAGAIAALLTFAYFLPFLYVLSPRVSAFVADGSFDLGQWATSQRWVLLALFLATGVFLSVVSSWAAVRRYVR